MIREKNHLSYRKGGDDMHLFGKIILGAVDLIATGFMVIGGYTVYKFIEKKRAQ